MKLLKKLINGLVDMIINGFSYSNNPWYCRGFTGPYLPLPLSPPNTTPTQPSGAGAKPKAEH